MSECAEGVLNSYLPAGWWLTHLILDNHIWQAIATDDEHVATATGESIEDAIALTSTHIYAERFVGRIFDGVHKQAQPQADLSFLKPKLPVITRRL